LKISKPSLTANSKAYRLYAGVNPIGGNQIKSEPAINENFLRMGILVAETSGATINSSPGDNQRWTGDHSALVIRNSFQAAKFHMKATAQIQNKLLEYKIW
jgi:hypothetical protein